MTSAPLSRTRERLGGAFLLAGGIGLFWLVWHQEATTGRYNIAGAMFAPFGLIAGAALLAMPGYRTERAMRGESMDGLTGWQALTPRWRLVTAAALAAGLLHVALLSGGLSPLS